MQVNREKGQVRSLIHKGDVLYNPVTKERMTFLETAAETGGEYTAIELRAEPGAVVAAAHVHPSQTERFEILEGRLAAKVDGEAIEAGPGDVIVVEPGQAHKWWNAGDGELVFRTEIRPSLQFERLIETMFSLAADGKTNRKGLPNPLRLAVIARHHVDDVVLPFPPAGLQKLGLALAAPLGRVAGYRETYEAVSVRPAYAH
jgi:quercetin dioxygenase-like cupin family protein